jgi:hypothetical protein
MRKSFRKKYQGINRDALKVSGLCLLLAAGTQAFMACDSASTSTVVASGGAGSGGGTTGTGGTSGTTGSSGTTASSGVDPTQFTVTVTPIQNVTSLIHQGGLESPTTGNWTVNEFAYTTPCSISLAQIEAANAGFSDEVIINCIVEEAELDLYMNGVSLNINIPPGVCNYTEVMPPYYYTYPTGVGPSDVEYNDSTGTPVNVANTVNGAPYCPYDFSTTSNPEGAPGPNCCLGNYNLVVAGTGSSTTTAGEWGGSVSDCLGGPAMATQPLDQAGYPRPIDYQTLDSGMYQTYTVASPSSRDDNSNLYVANYFPNWTTTADYPVAFNPSLGVAAPTSAGYSGYVAATVTTEPFFRFDCLDQANVWVATSYSDTSGTDPVSGIPYHRFDIWPDIESYDAGLLPGDAPLAGTAYQTGYPEYYH